MLCRLFGTGLMVTPLPLLVVSVLVFIAGTEIRVRIEDRLLAFTFQRQVPGLSAQPPHGFEPHSKR
jgi:hypothetical protein